MKSWSWAGGGGQVLITCWLCADDVMKRADLL